MSRRILNTGIAFLCLIVFVGSSVLSSEHCQAADTLATCWRDLAAEDAELAYRASWRLVQNPESAVKLLGAHLKAAEAPDVAKIQAWLNDLSNAAFVVRDGATKGLESQGELAESSLRKALKGKLDLETRRRVEVLLSKLDQAVASPDKLRQIRAVEVLEMLTNTQGKELLQLLALGYPAHRQTRLAQESLQRLKEREPVPERWLAWAKSPPSAAGKDEPLPLGARTRLGTTRFRHEGPGQPTRRERTCAFSPDSRLVISHDQNAIYVWETQTGKLQRKFDIAATCMDVAPKGTVLAIGLAGTDQESGVVVYWDWHAGKELSRLVLPSGVMIPHHLAFSPDGGKVFCQSSDGGLRVWDTKSAQATSLWQPADILQKLHGFAPDGTVVVVGAKRPDLYILDLKKNQKHLLPAMEREVRQVTFSTDGKYVAIASDYSGERLHICDTATGKLLWRPGDGIGSFVYSARFSANSKIFAAASYRQEISLWDVQTGKFHRSLAGSFDRGIGAISPDGRWLASAGQTLDIWNLETGQRVHAGDGHFLTIEGLAFSPRYDWIATFDRKEVHLWDPLTGKHKHFLDTGDSYMRGVAVSPDGQLIAAAQPGPGEGFIKVWQTATGRQVYRFPGHAVRDFGRHADVHFSRDGRFLLSWGDDYYLRKWDMKTGRALVEIQTRPPGLRQDDKFGFVSVQHAWTARFDRFLVLAPNGELRTFDVNTGQESPVVKLRPTTFADTFAFSPTAKLVAVCGRDFNLTVFDTNSRKEVFTVALPRARPRSLLFSPDERTLVAAVDGKIVVVEIASGKVRLTFAANAETLTFAADGRFLAAAMADNTALLWDLAKLAEASKK